MLRWFVNNGDEVFVWSAGGVDYAKMIVEKLGLDEMVTVIPKGKFGDRSNPADIDLTFDDDKEEKIGRVNITVFRNHGDLTSSE